MTTGQKKETSYGWFKSTYLMIIGFFRLLKYALTIKYHYPTIDNPYYNPKKMKSECEKNLQGQKISTWHFLRSNLFNKQSLVHLGEKFPFATVNFLKVGQQAPKGRLFTLDQQQTDLQNIFNQSAKKIHVLNFGSYS
ncbi:hypothetical protein TrispH2_011960 [Trichoplax sp. H2]|nr:hypothetical protein TrispH2_011960 [Trichoplax sp. H2]|eukprot:RDD35782.1 hypothetical protein TrispH2_011960 [Trichoplax sp. H2]